MAYRLKLQWKIVTELTTQGAVALQGSPRLFNLKGGKGFLRSIGGKIRTEYAPVVLEPTDVFHLALAELRTSLGIGGTKFPYDIAALRDHGITNVNATFRLYGRVLCLTISCQNDLEVGADFDIVTFQKLETHDGLSRLVKHIVALATTGDRRARPVGSLPKNYPLLHVVSLDADEEGWQRQLVALVTRHAMPNDDVVRSVLEKNRPHQVDSSLLLVDKQGVAAYVPASAHATIEGSLQRYGNASSMLELAAILRHQISNGRGDFPSDVINIILHADDAIPESVSAQRAWLLIAEEFRLRSEVERAVPKPAAARERILLVAVTKVEIRAIVSVFAAATGRSAMSVKKDGYMYQSLGEIGSYDVYLAFSEMGSGGVAGSQESIRRAIGAVKPDAVFMVGIAFGIDKKNFAIGDVLVSRQLLLYELQRLNSDSTITPRGDKIPASSRLLNWIRNAEVTYTSTDQHKVVSGLILSGEKLIDNKDYRDDLVKAAPDAVGGEMEGAGLYVACQDSKVDWILVKAICDWADGNKRKNKAANQEKAALNAAGFVAHALKSATAQAMIPSA